MFECCWLASGLAYTKGACHPLTPFNQCPLAPMLCRGGGLSNPALITFTESEPTTAGFYAVTVQKLDSSTNNWVNQTGLSKYAVTPTAQGGEKLISLKTRSAPWPVGVAGQWRCGPAPMWMCCSRLPGGRARCSLLSCFACAPLRPAFGCNSSHYESVPFFLVLQASTASLCMPATKQAGLVCTLRTVQPRLKYSWVSTSLGWVSPEFFGCSVSSCCACQALPLGLPGQARHHLILPCTICS